MELRLETSASRMQYDAAYKETGHGDKCFVYLRGNSARKCRENQVSLYYGNTDLKWNIRQQYLSIGKCDLLLL